MVHSVLQLETIKTLLKTQYGVPSGVLDQLDNIYRLTHQEGMEDEKARAQEEKDNEE